MSQHDNKIKDLLAKYQHTIDSTGKVLIEDDQLLAIIQGSMGESMGDMSDAMWNGACSNNHCVS